MKKKGNYNPEKIKQFMIMVRESITQPRENGFNYGQICKMFRVGTSNTLQAFESLGMVRRDGRGFKNWRWASGPVAEDDVRKFIDRVDEIKIRHRAKFPSERKKSRKHRAAIQNCLPFNDTTDRTRVLIEIRELLREINRNMKKALEAQRTSEHV
jgi:hypothetical protein